MDNNAADIAVSPGGAAVDGVYDDVVEQVSKLIVDAVGGQESWTPERASEADTEVMGLLRRCGREAMTHLLRQWGSVVIDNACRQGLSINKSKDITFYTLFGEVELYSPYLRNRYTGESARPVAEVMGLRDRGKSPAVQRALTDFGAEDSFAVARERFEEHYGWTIGRTSILRVVEDRAREAEEYVTERLASEVEEETPTASVMLIELDGCEIRTGSLEDSETEEVTAVRGLPKRTRREAWRDLRLGFARRLDGEDKTFAGAIAPYPEVVEQLHQAARHMGLGLGTLVVAPMDGGRGLREAIQARFGDVIVILDKPHLTSHFYETAKAMELDEAEQHRWVHGSIHQLSEGHISQVLTDLAVHRGPGEDRARQLHNHLWRFQDAVDYGDFHAFGLPLGSGEVESAHRYIPQRRLKIAGACWKLETVNPMLALRLLRANGWWQDFWESRDVRRAA